jgi:transposase
MRDAAKMIGEGQTLRQVAKHYCVGHSTIARILEREAAA